MRKWLWLIAIPLIVGCSNESTLMDMVMPSDTEIGVFHDADNVAASPMWVPDAIEMDELIYPYIAKHCAGIHNISGEAFRLASAEVLYKSRRVRYSEQNKRWVRLSTGQYPTHATDWTHGSDLQSLFIFLNFDSEADYQSFGVGTHANVPFIFSKAFLIRANTWEVHLMYRTASQQTTDTEPDTDPSIVLPTDTDAKVLVAGGLNVDAITLTKLGDLGIRRGRAVYGTQKVISTVFSIEDIGFRNGRHWVRLPTARDDLRIYIYSAEGAFSRGATYSHVHVSIQRLTGSDGNYALWLTHIP